MRFPPTPIDFANDVGLTGQDHDNYPSADQQPRYDWMRMTLIALLANQASYQEPTQCRDGTWWFDLNTSTIKIRRNDQFVPAAEAMLVDVDQRGNPITLSDAYATIKTLLGYRPSATFSGHCNNPNVQIIPIPQPLLTAAGADSQPFVWINGKLVDPRLTRFIGGAPTSVQLLSGVTLQPTDIFTVLIISLSQEMFYQAEVIV
jgi:hypothetical protein